MAVENTQKLVREKDVSAEYKAPVCEEQRRTPHTGDEEHRLTSYTRTVKIFEGYTSGYAILNDCGRTNVVHVLYRSSAHESPSYATLKDDFLEDIRSHWQNLGFGFVSL